MTVKNAVGRWTAATADTYSAFGNSNFILFHGDFGVQALAFNSKLLIASGGQVEFDKATGYATLGEYLTAQVSTNDGATWSDVFSEKGTSIPTTTLSTCTSVSVKVLLRWCISLHCAFGSRCLLIIRSGRICMTWIGGVILDGNDRLSLSIYISIKRTWMFYPSNNYENTKNE